VPKEIKLVREWSDSWKGLGQVVVGIERQGYECRATFHDNPLMSAEGFATDEKPWRAGQRSAWDALINRRSDPASPAGEVGQP
jgi:hypothetical protein